MSSRCLLVIDGDPAVHENLGGLLKHEDRKIQDAYNEPDAVKRLRASKYDVVLAGQGNNGFDGLSLMRRMRSLQPGAKVIVTGDADPSRVVRARPLPPPAPAAFSDFLAGSGIEGVAGVIEILVTGAGEDLAVSATAGFRSGDAGATGSHPDT